MEPNWTDKQKQAIKERNKTILVSAAAGSGKTATMTERIVRRLTDKERPLNISKMLIVTFTRLSAADLKRKISEAISKEIAKNPTNQTLSKQLVLLESAHICTIDSFYLDIVSSNFQRLGLPSNFRLADEGEMALLRREIMESIIEKHYDHNAEADDNFPYFVENFTSTKQSDTLADIFLALENKLCSRIEGANAILTLANEYIVDSEKDFFASRQGKIIKNYIVSGAKSYHDSLTRCCNVIASEEKASAAYLAVFSYERDFFAKLLDALSKDDYNSARQISLSFNKQRLGTLKKEFQTEDILLCKALRDEETAFVKNINEKIFSFDSEDIKKTMINTSELLRSLHQILTEFQEAALNEKIKRKVFDFDDIRRFAYKLLTNEDGSPSDIALAYKEQFEEIYIDEYQDVDKVQDLIFSAISKSTNRFMVGDIKQSIYGFRSARPEIFAKMKNEFPEINNGTSNTASIFMSKNFRSDKGIIDFTNAIFDTAFSAFGKSIGYKSEDRLTFAKTAPSSNEIPTLTVFEKNGGDSDEEDEELGKPEPRAVAKKIAEILDGEKLADGSPVKPSDIAIIMRSVRGKSTAYKEALDELGIPSQIVEGKSFFLNSEVLLALCLLNSIDNPRRDIYLAGLMRSPIFNFSADELLKIRKSAGHTLYDSIKAYTEESPNDAKTADFLRTLSEWRGVSEGMNVHTLLAKLYHETSLLSLAASNGKKENLILLYDLARRFEGSEFKGLYSFISYINNVINKKARFEDTAQSTEENAVKIVTVHGSKGLEYPIVFYTETGRNLSDKDSKNRAVYVEDFGICMYLRSSDGLALVKNPVREVINRKAQSAAFEEELRVLYVALTRARERLYVSGERSSEKEKYDTEISLHRRRLDEYSECELKSHLAIMLSSGVPFTEGRLENPSAEVGTAQSSQAEAPTEVGIRKESQFSKEELRDLLVERFNFVYPNKYLTEIPEKLSVSALYPEILDGNDDTAVKLEVGEENTEKDVSKRQRRCVPKFIGGRTKAENSALAGIATHLYLQFFNLNELAVNGSESELKRLVGESFISEDDAERVRLDEIELFRKSELFKKMRSAKGLWRELRFNIRLPAEAFTNDPDRLAAISGRKILVQGVIDCIMENESGELSIIDYKTDRLTAQELQNEALAKEKLTVRHAQQLSYYRCAVTKMFGKEPTKIEIYSLPLGKTIEIETKKI